MRRTARSHLSTIHSTIHSTSSNDEDRPSVEPRLDPSAHTLAAALERVRIACDRAARAAERAARRRGAPDELQEIALRRIASVRAVTKVSARRSARAGWMARSVDVADRIRRRLRGEESPHRTYLRQARLTERAIAACADVLAMRLPTPLRRVLEQEQSALEVDRRVLRALAREAPRSTPHHESAVLRTGRLALGAMAAALWQVRGRQQDRRHAPPA